MCYQLYYNKDEVKIKVSILSNVFKHSFKIQETIERLKENEIWNYNSFYIFANNRKLLKLKGEELKQQWLLEAEDKLNAIKNIKI